MVSCPCYVFLEASAGIPGVQRVGLYVLGYHGVHADDSPIADGCTLQDFDIPTQPDMISYVDGSGRIQQPLFCIKNWVSVTCPDINLICNHAFCSDMNEIVSPHADEHYFARGGIFFNANLAISSANRNTGVADTASICNV